MTTDDIQPHQHRTYDVPQRLRDPSRPTPYIDSREKYDQMYKDSITNGDAFWGNLANDLLTWHKPFTTVKTGDFIHGDIAWFQDGQLNASYNCLDRHYRVTPDKVAIIWEADEPGHSKKITFRELYHQVCQLANVLRDLGIKKGDTIAIYLPMIPEAVVAFLACARIGAVHSVVFAGFSAESLRDRINDAESRIIITSDEGKRGGKTIATKVIVDDALKSCKSIQHSIVIKRTGAKVNMTPGRDLWYHEEIAKHRPVSSPELMNAEDPLFLLYTSGSTGKPKGVVHTTGGYLVGAAATLKYVFDVHKDDIFACMADVGWITGHTYIIYGPLSQGITSVLFESTPIYPDASRYWRVVEEHKITQFYTAPTAIRLLRKMGDKFVEGFDLSSLRIIGSVGEPINPEAWEWYYEKVGHGKCAVLDTYWQTETGSHVITPFPGAIKLKPGSASVPFFGIELAILNPETGKEIQGNNVEGVLAIKQPWPSMMRSVYRNHDRFLSGYLKPYPGYYFTGDGAGRDQDGYYWIRGRVDDVINVSGHRLSTAEIESALIEHQGVAETAVIGVADDMTGQAVNAYVTLKPSYITKDIDEVIIVKELILVVRRVIGPFAAPKKIYIVQDLPKTRSGKIMRRVLRKISSAEEDQLGDLSTLADPSIVDSIILKVKESRK